MKITYKASNKKGEIKEGIIDARDVNQAISFIRTKDLIPISVQEKHETQFMFPTSFNKVTNKNVIELTRQIASMLSSGLNLIQALSILKDQSQNPAMKDMVTGIMEDVQEGKAFSYAISKYPKVFSPIYISLVKSGEASGLLDKIFDRLAETLEKNQKLKGMVISALIYPTIIVGLMIAVITIMMIFVIPQLETLYNGLNSTLPLPTQIVVGVSHFITNFWPIIIGFIILMVLLYKRWNATEIGKVLQDEAIINIPLVGKIIRLSILTEFARTFGLLIGAGALVVESLTKTADTAGNRVYKDAIIDVSHRVEKGISVGDAMATYDIFPPVLVQMVRIGEQTGKLDDSLLKVSEYFEREVEIVIKSLTTAIEPVIMVVLGIGVAFILISIITPIYNLSSSIK